jgi:hypothetical protein
MRIALFALLLAISLAQGAVQPALTDPEAYRVYAALLPNEWTVRSAHAKTLVFEEETSMPKMCPEPSGGVLNTEWRDVLDDFHHQNAVPKRLLPGMDLGIPYVVVPRADILASFTNAPNDRMGGWTAFYQTYPDSGGHMMVSGVGFNPQKTRAIVYMGHSCGLLCGGGTYYFLENSSGRWREMKLRDVKSCAWAS